MDLLPWLLTPLAVAAAGAAWERALRARDRRRFPPPERLQDLGGHVLHHSLHGSAGGRAGADDERPLVVLEADLGEWSTHWGRLPERIGAFAPVLAYDRAGLGWSEPGPGPRNVETLARELHQLLARVAPGRRVVLVGHGHGALVARTFAQRYPFETSGLVLVDPDPEGLAEVLRARGVPSPELTPGFVRLLALANGLGLLRALRIAPSVPPTPQCPVAAHERAALVALGHRPSVLTTLRQELESRAEDLSRIGTRRDPLACPVRVVSAGHSLLKDGVPRGFPVDLHNELRVAQQAVLLEHTSDGQQRVAGASPHHVHLHSPDVVLEAVREVLAAAPVPEPA